MENPTNQNFVLKCRDDDSTEENILFSGTFREVSKFFFNILDSYPPKQDDINDTQKSLSIYSNKDSEYIVIINLWAPKNKLK